MPWHRPAIRRNRSSSFSTAWRGARQDRKLADLTDVLQRTTPNEKGLRELQRTLDTLPAACKTGCGIPPLQSACSKERIEIHYHRLPTLDKAEPLVFPSPVSIAAFSGDSKRFFVLTANQVAYVLDTAALLRAPASTSEPVCAVICC
jgi:hypothetical protein